jgi:hypothetical protein
MAASTAKREIASSGFLIKSMYASRSSFALAIGSFSKWLLSVNRVTRTRRSRLSDDPLDPTEDASDRCSRAGCQFDRG